MGITSKVAEMVRERGSATADDLFPLLQPEGYTRQQIIKALQNGRMTKLLACDGHTPKRGNVGGGSQCAVYRPLGTSPQWPEKKFRTKKPRRPKTVDPMTRPSIALGIYEIPMSQRLGCTAPSSVWDYAQRFASIPSLRAA